uniref:Hydroxymethylbilane synthase n=1 Tax=Mus musculus TaxID=10090 RepID=A0A1L1SU93_MOUSE
MRVIRVGTRKSQLLCPPRETRFLILHSLRLERRACLPRS